jgi:hypothetical protein
MSTLMPPWLVQAVSLTMKAILAASVVRWQIHGWWCHQSLKLGLFKSAGVMPPRRACCGRVPQGGVASVAVVAVVRGLAPVDRIEGVRALHRLGGIVLVDRLDGVIRIGVLDRVGPERRVRTVVAVTLVGVVLPLVPQAVGRREGHVRTRTR